MTKIKTALVDLHCPRGHANLINFYVKNFKKETKLLVLNKSIKKVLRYQKAFYLNYSKSFLSKFHALLYLYKLLSQNKITSSKEYSKNILSRCRKRSSESKILRLQF